MNGPIESVQGKNTEFIIKAAVCTALQKELHQLRDMLAKNRYLLSLESVHWYDEKRE